MLNAGQKKKYSNSCVVRKFFSERNRASDACIYQ